MKKNYNFLQVAILICFLFSSSIIIAQKDVYLIIGERNAQGRAEIEAEDEIALTDVGLWDGTTWEDAKNDSALAPDGGLNRYSSNQKAASDQKLNFAYAFGKMVNEVTGNEIGLVVSARSGADIEQWLKGTGGGYYEAALADLNAAVALEAGSTVKGILWCHGEADRNDSGYIADLTTLINDFRTDLGIADLPFIACEISRQRLDNVTFNENIKNIANAGDANYIADTDYVSSDGLQTIAGSENDYNSNSQRVLGYRYAAKILEMAYGYTYVENHIMYLTEDAYVRGGTNSGTAWEPGDDQRIRTKYTTSSPNNERMGLMKFDLSTLTGTADRIVVDATLKVNVQTIDGDMDISFFDMYTGWSESTVTLDEINANGGFATAITKSATDYYRDTVDRDGDLDTTELIHNGADLTEFLKDEYNSGTSTIALGVQSDNDDGNDLEFTTKEHLTESALKPYIVVSYLVAPRVSAATTKLAKLTFETDPTDTDPAITDISYTTSLTYDATSLPVASGEHSDGSADYFTRTYNGDMVGTQISSDYTYTKPVDLGDYFFAANDIDDTSGGIPTYTVPVTIALDAIDIENYENLEFRVYLASVSDASRGWDNQTSGSAGNDYVHFRYDVDNGGFNELLWIESECIEGTSGTSGTLNEEPRIDTNFNGRGDGTQIESTFTQFTAPILTTGNTLNIEIEFHLNNDHEDIAIDNIEIWGTLANSTCTGTDVTWTGGAWDNGTGPTINDPVVIDDDYSTDTDGGSFSACSLIVNADLTVDTGYYIEVEHDVTINTDGSLTVENDGAFVQNVDTATFTHSGTGTTSVIKRTDPLINWYDYTFWSTPVSGLTIGTSPLLIANRSFWHNANNYLDEYEEIGNTGTFVVAAAGVFTDEIDDNGDDWQWTQSSTPMTPGVGFIASHTSNEFVSGTAYDYEFVGELNNGEITTPIVYNPANTSGHWNLIGNPYASALDFDAFVTNNSSIVDGLAYLWSHQSQTHESATSGNQVSNFSNSSYVMMNTGSGSVNNDPDTILEYIPACQSFFIAGISNDDVTFNNSMRIKNGSSNTQFFKNSNSKSIENSEANKLWINLTTSIGGFNQILIAYVDGATNNYDGLSYDAPRQLTGVPAIIYTQIADQYKKFAIQGKNINSINEDEVIPLGFSTVIESTTYNLSIGHLKGSFLTENPIYLRDNLQNYTHNLSESDYSFTSAIGEFNNRFEIVFTNNALSTNDHELDNNALQIINLDDHKVNFKASNNLTIKNVSIYDLFGRKIANFKGETNSETYSLSNLSDAVYMAKVELSNNIIVTKKFTNY